MKAKKKYGQNFLIDQNIINQIISLIDIADNTLVLEIGPGRGALTSQLVKLNCDLICVEIDTDMHKYLSKFESDKCKIIYNDILTINLKSLLNNGSYDKLIVIGNLPYYITSPIMEHLVKSDCKIQEMIFMVQKEVAYRYAAKPCNKDYGYISVFLQSFYDINIAINVPNICFNPPPKVQSAVIKMISNGRRYNGEEEQFFSFVKEAFHLKRKTLKNNLNMYDWKVIEEFLITNNLSTTIRSEELSEQLLRKLFKQINS